jgi:hypothetical protein
MTRDTMDRMAAPLRILTLAACAVTVAATEGQAQQGDQGPWTIGAWSGAYVPFSSLIRTADEGDTGLAAGPAFAVEVRYGVTGSIAAYANATASFGTIRLGSAIRPTVVGPSNRVTLLAGTAGVVLTGAGWLGEHLAPTLRLGGGLKSYAFDLTDAESQIRPTADVGVGFVGLGIGRVEVAAEVRYLPSTFDQAKLPIRGIAPQDQRQSDLMLSVGIGIRP